MFIISSIREKKREKLRLQKEERERRRKESEEWERRYQERMQKEKEEKKKRAKLEYKEMLRHPEKIYYKTISASSKEDLDNQIAAIALKFTIESSSFSPSTHTVVYEEDDCWDEYHYGAVIGYSTRKKGKYENNIKFQHLSSNSRTGLDDEINSFLNNKQVVNVQYQPVIHEEINGEEDCYDYWCYSADVSYRDNLKSKSKKQKKKNKNK